MRKTILMYRRIRDMTDSFQFNTPVAQIVTPQDKREYLAKSKK